MKKIFLACLTFLVQIVIFSCGKDDEKVTPVDPIVSKWEYFKEGKLVNGVEVLDNYTHETQCGMDYINLNADGTGSTKFYYKDSQDACKSQVYPLIWKKENSNLIFTENGETWTETILSLSNTELKLKDEEGLIMVYKKS